MPISTNPIVTKIEAHIEKRGGRLDQWYVGIAADAEDRLFSDHRVRKIRDAWIHHPTATNQEARQIEDYFVNTLGAQGGTGGGDAATCSVYAYKIAPHTKE